LSESDPNQIVISGNICEGMLSNAVYILSMNNYGLIADNAAGVAEMSMQPENVRETTDLLDAAGNVTKAITKVSCLPISAVRYIAMC